jgi:hypothetical protein
LHDSLDGAPSADLLKEGHARQAALNPPLELLGP